MRLIIKRVAHNHDGTFGVMLFDEHGSEDGLLPLVVTLEPTWVDNIRNISCIPVGEYKCVKRWSAKFEMETFEVTGVPDRSDIILHKGNTLKDTEGCILVGLAFGVVASQLGIFDSRKAFDKFMRMYGHFKEFDLEIKDVA